MSLKKGPGATCFQPGHQGEGIDGSDDVVDGTPMPGCGNGPQGKAHEAFEATARGFDDVEFVQTTSSTVAKAAGASLHPAPASQTAGAHALPALVSGCNGRMGCSARADRKLVAARRLERAAGAIRLGRPLNKHRETASDLDHTRQEECSRHSVSPAAPVFVETLAAAGRGTHLWRVTS